MKQVIKLQTEIFEAQSVLLSMLRITKDDEQNLKEKSMIRKKIDLLSIDLMEALDKEKEKEKEKNIGGENIKSYRASKKKIGDLYIKAKETLAEVEKKIEQDSNYRPNPQEVEIMKGTVGRGGKSVYEYFTPKKVAGAMWDLVEKNTFLGDDSFVRELQVLEPSAGVGVFSDVKKDMIEMTCIEKDPIYSRINAVCNPDDKVQNTTFEEYGLKDETFDAIIGNVPFGNARGKEIVLDPEFKDEKYLERFFILKSLKKCRPGGLLVLIVPTTIIGSKGKRWANFRKKVSSQAEFLGAHKMPNGTFKSSGTDTVTDIIAVSYTHLTLPTIYSV